MSKETFIIRSEWYGAIRTLDQESKALLFDCLFEYHSDEEPKINLNNLNNLNNPMVNLVWQLIEPNLKRNLEAYDKRISTSRENGRLGGRPPKSNNLNKPNETQAETQKPNETLSVSVSVSDSVNDPDSVLDLAKAKSTSNIILEEKKKKENFNFLKALISEGVPELAAKDYLTVRRTKKAANTETAFNLLRSEQANSGLSFPEVIKTCIAQNWVGFKMAWYKNLNNSNSSKQDKNEYLKSTGQDIDAIIAHKFASAN